MDLLKSKIKLEEVNEEKEIMEELLVYEINRIIKPIYKKTISSYYNIKISIRIFNKDDYQLFRGLRCVEIWETNDNAYAKNYVFPISFLKIKGEKRLKIAFENIKTKEIERKTKIEAMQKKENKKENERRERKEYLRLKRKFNK